LTRINNDKQFNADFSSSSPDVVDDFVPHEGGQATRRQISSPRFASVPIGPGGLREDRTTEQTHPSLSPHFHPTQLTAAMASIMRPSVLRQTCSLASATRSFSTKPTFASTAFRTSVLCRTRPMQSAFVPYTSPRIAAFHATGVKALLPALPRMSFAIRTVAQNGTNTPNRAC